MESSRGVEPGCIRTVTTTHDINPRSRRIGGLRMRDFQLSALHLFVILRALAIWGSC